MHGTSDVTVRTVTSVTSVTTAPLRPTSPDYVISVIVPTAPYKAYKTNVEHRAPTFSISSSSIIPSPIMAENVRTSTRLQHV